MSRVQALDPGLTLIDVELYRPRLAASYLLVDAGRAAFVETGTSRAVPALLAALAERGLSPVDVDYVIVTHVHLDHAGGAGRLLAELPGAKLVVHPRGARHLVAPDKLWAGATAVYGADFLARHYGELVPVPAERVLEAADGMTLRLGERELRLVFAEGHARHHLCVHDPARRGCFTGDAFGLGYPELARADRAWLFPTTSPVQFDPEAMHATFSRIAALELREVYLTHFGRAGHVPQLAAHLHALLDAMVAEARREPDPARLRARLDALYARSLAEAGLALDDETRAAVLGQDLTLNADGLAHWLKSADKTKH